MNVDRTFVIGDIHGCADEIEVLISALRPSERDRLYFLGDYIDRGPASRAVVECLLELSDGPSQCVFLRGNHEDMFIDFIGRRGGHFGDAYLDNGGASTLRSYGLVPRQSADLHAELPRKHLEFFDKLEMTADLGRSLCVHAGLRPTVPLDRQSAEDMLWIRNDFYGGPHPFGKIILYGHTPRRAVEIAMPHRIGLDTGLVYGGSLSCLELESALLWQVQRHSKQVTTQSIREQLAGLPLT